VSAEIVGNNFGSSYISADAE